MTSAASPSRREEVRAALRVIRYVWACQLFLFLWLHFSYVKPQISIAPALLYTIYALGVATLVARNVIGFWYGGLFLHGVVFNGLAIAFITLGIMATGRLESELWLVYFVFLITETLTADRRLMLATTAVVVVSYLAATWPGTFTLTYAERVGTRLFFLIIVGAIARAMSSNEMSRNQELALLREQVAVGEERTRIAREIHDGVGHALTSVILQLELCQRLVRRDPAGAEAVLEEQKALLRHAMDEARELVFHLRPLELEVTGFAASVQRHVQQLSRRAGLAVDLSLPEKALPLSPAVELALARIIQEALTNTARHAAAAHATVEVRVERDRVLCAITDDGRGFDPSDPAAGGRAGGFGLKGMRERATALGGTLEIDSAPDQGARIQVTLPVR